VKAVATPRVSVDFVARLADAWDGVGAHPFQPPTEQRALLSIAGLPVDLVTVRWRNLSESERDRILRAARAAIVLGRQCAWIFGEGRGA
jgi:hypothetical protein